MFKSLSESVGNFFSLPKGSSVRTEVMAGLATFLTMAYITVVNPAILSTEGNRMESPCPIYCNHYCGSSRYINNGTLGFKWS